MNNDTTTEVIEYLKFDFGAGGAGGNVALSTMVQEILFTQGAMWRSAATTPWEPSIRFIAIENNYISFFPNRMEWEEALEKETCPYKFLAQHNKLTEYIEKKYGLLPETEVGKKIEFTGIKTDTNYLIIGTDTADCWTERGEYHVGGEWPEQNLKKVPEAIVQPKDNPEFSDGSEFRGGKDRSKSTLSRRVKYLGPTTNHFKKDHIYYINEFGANPNPKHVMHRFRDERGDLVSALASAFEILPSFVEDTTPIGILMFG